MPIIQVTKKPVTVEALQYTGSNLDEIEHFIGKTVTYNQETIFIPTLEGNMSANPGDYIIKGVAGEFYPCKREIFLTTYSYPQENPNVD